MVTSKKTPARKIAKRTRMVEAKAVDRVAATKVVDADATPAATPVPLEKQKLVRDGFTMPKREYEQIGVLKARLLKLEHVIKKGELLRAGIAVLASMRDADLLAAVTKIQRLKRDGPKSRGRQGTTGKKKG